MYYIEDTIKWCKNKSFCLQWYPDKINIFEGFKLKLLILSDEHWFGLYTSFLGNIFSFDLSWTRKRDHAGFNFDLTVLGQSFIFYTYDHRHWDDDKNDWEVKRDSN